VGSDATTQGNWKGAYGQDGFAISSDPSANDPTTPAYLAGFNVSGAAAGAWGGAASTGEVRALQKAAAGSTDRIASYWTFSTSFAIDLNLTDGQGRHVSD
jgi:hypothetical protein